MHLYVMHPGVGHPDARGSSLRKLVATTSNLQTPRFERFAACPPPQRPPLHRQGAAPVPVHLRTAAIPKIKFTFNTAPTNLQHACGFP